MTDAVKVTAAPWAMDDAEADRAVVVPAAAAALTVMLTALEFDVLKPVVPL